MSNTNSWTLTLTPENTPPIALTGLSPDQMRRALWALMSGDDQVIEQLTDGTAAAPVELAA